MKINKRPYEIKSLGLNKNLKEIFRNIDNGWDIADLIQDYNQFISYNIIQSVLESNAPEFRWENKDHYNREDYKKAELKYLALKLQDFL